MIFLFDCFGVVVDWKSDYVIPLWAKYARISDVEFKKKCSEELDLCETGQISNEELWSRWGEKFSVPAAGLEQLFVQSVKTKARLDEKVVGIIENLPGRSYMLSNQLPLIADYCKKQGWFSHFQRVFLSFDVGYIKPDPRAYYAVLKELGVPAHDVVLIDDKKENVDSAIRCGMKGLVFSSADQLCSDLEKVYNVKLNKRKYDFA